MQRIGVLDCIRAQPMSRVAAAAVVACVHVAIVAGFVTRAERTNSALERVSDWMRPEVRNDENVTPPIAQPQPTEMAVPRVVIDAPNLPPMALEGSASVDWNREANLGAQSIVDGLAAQKERRRFGPQPRLAAPEPQRSPFVVPKHKLGDLDEDHHGENIVWLSESCYMTLDKRLDKDVGRPTIESMPKQWCVLPIGEKPARGDLFEDLPSRRRCAPDDQACIDSLDLRE